MEHQAGIPVLMQPLSGNSSDGKAFGQVVSDHMAQLQTTYSPTYLVADSALYNAENLQKLVDYQPQVDHAGPSDLDRGSGGPGPGAA